jgi:hypothetical protein
LQQSSYDDSIASITTSSYNSSFGPREGRDWLDRSRQGGIRVGGGAPHIDGIGVDEEDLRISGVEADEIGGPMTVLLTTRSGMAAQPDLCR